jgi:hypothetical protein
LAIPDDATRMEARVAPVDVKGVVVFSFLDPRATDLVLGLVIGLTFALACHWVAWVVR